MTKKNNNIELADLDAMPELLDGRHHVVPIITSGDDIVEEIGRAHV